MRPASAHAVVALMLFTLSMKNLASLEQNVVSLSGEDIKL